jgi:hypothetical protein
LIAPSTVATAAAVATDEEAARIDGDSDFLAPAFNCSSFDMDNDEDEDEDDEDDEVGWAGTSDAAADAANADARLGERSRLSGDEREAVEEDAECDAFAFALLRPPASTSFNNAADMGVTRGSDVVE